MTIVWTFQLGKSCIVSSYFLWLDLGLILRFVKDYSTSSADLFCYSNSDQLTLLYIRLGSVAKYLRIVAYLDLLQFGLSKSKLWP